MVGALGEQGHSPLCADRVMSVLLILVRRCCVMLQSLRALFLQLEAAGSVQPVCLVEVANLFLTSCRRMNGFRT